MLRKKTLIVSAATVVVLTGAGVSYAIMQPKQPVNNQAATVTSEQVASPSPSPKATIEASPAAATSTAPSVTPTPQPSVSVAPQAPDPSDINGVLRFYGVAESDLQYATMMTQPSGWHYSSMKIVDGCNDSYSTLVKCFTDYATSKYGSWSAAVNQFKTNHLW